VGGFGSPSRSRISDGEKPSESSFEIATRRHPDFGKRVLALYGGDIQRGTVERITSAKNYIAQTNPALAEVISKNLIVSLTQPKSERALLYSSIFSSYKSFRLVLRETNLKYS
jgi:hypothetical protein